VPKVAVTVITRNEAAHIQAALETVSWADEIVLVDACSTDDTVAIARRFTDRVSVRDWPGYSDQKNHAAGLASHDWILSLDADERVSPDLALEIRRVLAGTPAAAAYRIPRLSCYLGRWLRSTDWYPDYQTRLYDRRVAQWQGRHVHESVRVDGATATLRCDLLHYPYRDISHHLQTIDRYTTLAAAKLHEAGQRASVVDVVIRPPLAFLRNYLVRYGIRDGGPGLLVSLLNSYYVLIKFAKLWELGRTSSTGGPKANTE
jgi:glycosyltransferase involved in cell wall biosynthesis